MGPETAMKCPQGKDRAILRLVNGQGCSCLARFWGQVAIQINLSSFNWKFCILSTISLVFLDEDGYIHVRRDANHLIQYRWLYTLSQPKEKKKKKKSSTHPSTSSSPPPLCSARRAARVVAAGHPRSTCQLSLLRGHPYPRRDHPLVLFSSAPFNKP